MPLRLEKDPSPAGTLTLAGTVILKVPGLTIRQNQALASEFAIEASRTLQEQQRHDRLTALGLPLAQVAFDHEGIDEGAIFAIAEQLTDRMSLEAA